MLRKERDAEKHLGEVLLREEVGDAGCFCSVAFGLMPTNE